MKRRWKEENKKGKKTKENRMTNIKDDERDKTKD